MASTISLASPRHRKYLAIGLAMSAVTAIAGAVSSRYFTFPFPIGACWFLEPLTFVATSIAPAMFLLDSVRFPHGTRVYRKDGPWFFVAYIVLYFSMLFALLFGMSNTIASTCHSRS